MNEFALETLSSGTKITGRLTAAPRADGDAWRLPILAARGLEPGPTLLVMAGVHGDEYEGIEAIPKVFAAVDVTTLRGTLIMAPVCNLPAYEAAQRNSPVDGLNLARVFPGRADGTVTERIAHVLTDRLMRHADFLLDLHSGGAYYKLPSLIGYMHDNGDLGQRSWAAAQAFGAAVLWGHPLPMPPGRSLSAATELGIPSLYTEAPGGGYARHEDVTLFSRGVRNLMQHLGMLAGAPDSPDRGGVPSVHLVGDGNLDVVTTAPCAGFFRAQVQLLDTVRPGQILGTVTDFYGTVQAEVRAHTAGVVIMIRRFHRVHAGEGLLHLTQTAAAYAASRSPHTL